MRQGNSANSRIRSSLGSNVTSSVVADGLCQRDYCVPSFFISGSVYFSGTVFAGQPLNNQTCDALVGVGQK